uniref:Uncharacterized protein n=1 Tax=Siphoviridae sp. ct87j35 TaxID=2825356 RepID=A0A8S5V4J3_9CAUD|nr:MAG TPA: hypothetical protein [Siphoviridae sp. ct87j35]
MFNLHISINSIHLIKIIHIYNFQSCIKSYISI